MPCNCDPGQPCVNDCGPATCPPSGPCAVVGCADWINHCTQLACPDCCGQGFDADLGYCGDQPGGEGSPPVPCCNEGSFSFIPQDECTDSGGEIVTGEGDCSPEFGDVVLDINSSPESYNLGFGVMSSGSSFKCSNFVAIGLNAYSIYAYGGSHVDLYNNFTRNCKYGLYASQSSIYARDTYVSRTNVAVTATNGASVVLANRSYLKANRRSLVASTSYIWNKVTKHHGDGTGLANTLPNEVYSLIPEYFYVLAANSTMRLGTVPTDIQNPATSQFFGRVSRSDNSANVDATSVIDT